MERPQQRDTHLMRGDRAFDLKEIWRTVPKAEPKLWAVGRDRGMV
jgi:hypothetical protein